MRHILRRLRNSSPGGGAITLRYSVDDGDELRLRIPGRTTPPGSSASGSYAPDRRCPAEADHRLSQGGSSVRAPKYGTLMRVLDANGIPRDPYKPYLDAVNPVVVLSCPYCPRRLRLSVVNAEDPALRGKGRRGPRRLPDGTYAVPCARAPTGSCPESLEARTPSATNAPPGTEEADRVIDGAEQGDLRSRATARAIMLGGRRRGSSPPAEQFRSS